MKARGYRSFPGFLSAAKDSHVSEGHSWNDELERAKRRYTASTQRGIGPPRQSIEINLYQLMNTDLPEEPLHDDGPTCPKQWAVLCAFHMLRGGESACSLASSLIVDRESRTERFALSGSKMDPRAIGCTRSWGCVCPGECGGKRAVCPYNAAVQILADLTRRFGDSTGRLPADLALFPNAQGDYCTRDGFVATVAHFADLLQLQVADDMGRNTIGEHVWRVTGSRMLARAHVPRANIKLMARWGGDAIDRYIAEAPLETITSDFAASSTNRSGSGSSSPDVNHIVRAWRDESNVSTDVSNIGICTDRVPVTTQLQIASMFALNTTTGVLHMVATTSERDDAPVRSKCGRDFHRGEYRQLGTFTEHFLRHGVFTRVATCGQCARPQTWTAIKFASDGLSPDSDEDES